MSSSTINSQLNIRLPTLLAKRFLKHFSRREKQTTFVANGAIRVKIECWFAIFSYILMNVVNIRHILWGIQNEVYERGMTLKSKVKIKGLNLYSKK